MRYILIQRNRTWRIGADKPDNPVTAKQAFSEALEMVELDPDKAPVIVVEAPEGGVRRQLGTVGAEQKMRRRSSRPG